MSNDPTAPRTDTAHLTAGAAASDALPSALPDAPSALPDAPSALPDAPSALPDAPSALPDAPSALPDAPSALPDAPSALPDAQQEQREEPETLEGEDQESLVGIMYSEKKWVVPLWAKAVFFWAALSTLLPLAGYTAWKRITFHRLLVDGVVEPEDWKNVPSPGMKLAPGDGSADVDIAQFKGRWVLINFWATWCAPCRDEMPSMEMLNRRFERDGMPIELVAVSVDDDWAQVNRFFGDTRPTFRVLWDRDKAASGAWGTRKFPETYLVDPEGRVAAKFIGPRDWYNQATVQYFQDVLAGRRRPA